MASQSNEGPATADNPINNNNDGTTVIPTMTAQPPSQAPVANATTEGDNVTNGAAAVTPEGNRVTTTDGGNNTENVGGRIITTTAPTSTQAGSTASSSAYHTSAESVGHEEMMSYLDSLAHEFLEDLRNGPAQTMTNTLRLMLRDMVRTTDEQLALLERYVIVSFETMQACFDREDLRHVVEYFGYRTFMTMNILDKIVTQVMAELGAELAPQPPSDNSDLEH